MVQHNKFIIDPVVNVQGEGVYIFYTNQTHNTYVSTESKIGVH
jgi:hypothetical protein